MRGLRQGVVPELRHAFYDSDLSRMQRGAAPQRTARVYRAVAAVRPALRDRVQFGVHGAGSPLRGLYGGRKFLNRFCPFVFVWFSVEAIFWYFLIKVALSMLIGFFVTPVYLGYCIWRIWRLAF